MKRFFKWLLLLPVAIVVLVFAVANRQSTTVVIDPFGMFAQGVAISAPLYVILFLVLMLGVFIGGLASWLAQGVHRRAAREARLDVRAFREEAEQRREEYERLRAQLANLQPAGSSLVVPGRRDAA